MALDLLEKHENRLKIIAAMEAAKLGVDRMPTGTREMAAGGVQLLLGLVKRWACEVEVAEEKAGYKLPLFSVTRDGRLMGPNWRAPIHRLDNRRNVLITASGAELAAPSVVKLQDEYEFDPADMTEPFLYLTRKADQTVEFVRKGEEEAWMTKQKLTSVPGPGDLKGSSPLTLNSLRRRTRNSAASKRSKSKTKSSS